MSSAALQDKRTVILAAFFLFQAFSVPDRNTFTCCSHLLQAQTRLTGTTADMEYHHATSSLLLTTNYVFNYNVHCEFSFMVSHVIKQVLLLYHAPKLQCRGDVAGTMH